MSDIPPFTPTTPSAYEPTANELRLGVKALCSRAGEILLIKEGRSDGSTYWTLPGGGLSAEESHEASLRRELAEELQCVVTCGETIGRCSYDHTQFGDVTTLYTVYECSLETEPEPNRDESIRQHVWVEPSARPDGLLDPFSKLLDKLDDNGYFE